MIRKQSLAAGALCLSLMAGAAQGAVLWSFVETPAGDVVGTLSGSLDLTDATLVGPIHLHEDRIVPAGGYVSVSGSLDGYRTASGPAGFGFGSGLDTSGVGAGDAFLVNGGFGAIGVPAGYSGTQLDSTLTFAGTTFALLGITPGTYEYRLPNDTVTLRFTPGAVIPLPASLPLLLGALGLGLVAARRHV